MGGAASGAPAPRGGDREPARAQDDGAAKLRGPFSQVEGAAPMLRGASRAPALERDRDGVQQAVLSQAAVLYRASLHRLVQYNMAAAVSVQFMVDDPPRTLSLEG